jgi:hypothetical protein
MGLRMTAPSDNALPNAPNFTEDFQSSSTPVATATANKGSMRPLHRKELVERTDHSMQVVARHDSRRSSGYQSGERSGDIQDRKKSGDSDTPERRGRRQSPQRQTRVQSTEPRQEVPQSGLARPLPARAGRRLGEAAPQTQSPRGRPTGAIPSLKPEEQRLADYFELGVLQRAKNKEGQPIPGQFTFSGAPDNFSITREELPDLLMGLNFERLVQKAVPREKSLQAPFQYGGNIQSFQLFIVAPALALDYLLSGWNNLIFRIFTKAVFQVVVIGWDLKKVSTKPLFLSGRWTPSFREWERLKPDPEQVVGITVKMSEYERAKKAIGWKREVHVDLAGDLRKNKLQIIFRGEGVVKANALGVLWQISRVWRSFRSGKPTPGWENAKSYCDIAARVRGEWSKKREEALERGKKAVRQMEIQVDEEVKKLAANIGNYEGAGALGLKAEIGVDEKSVYSGLAPEYSNVPIEGRVAERGLPNGWVITFPMVVRLVKGEGGGGNRKMLTVKPAVHAMLKKMGVPTMDIDASSTNLTPQEQESLIPGACIWAQIFKAVEGAFFANVNCTPGTAYAGFFLDIGMVFPIIVGIYPFGKGGASSNAKWKGGVVLPVWVAGWSIQIFGNRDETVATAGIVVR